MHRLRDTVAPEVPEDPTRHLALTSAAQAYLDGDRETGVRKFATQDKNFYAGYTMDNLMADTRARLGTVAHFVPHFALRNTSSSRCPHLEPHLLAALTPALTRAALPSCSLSPLKLPRCLSCPLPLFAHVFGSPACSLPRDPSHDNLTCYLSLSLSLSASDGAAHSGADRDAGGARCHDDGQGHPPPPQGYVHLCSAGFRGWSHLVSPRREPKKEIQGRRDASPYVRVAERRRRRRRRNRRRPRRRQSRRDTTSLYSTNNEMLQGQDFFVRSVLYFGGRFPTARGETARRDCTPAVKMPSKLQKIMTQPSPNLSRSRSRSRSLALARSLSQTYQNDTCRHIYTS